MSSITVPQFDPKFSSDTHPFKAFTPISAISINRLVCKKPGHKPWEDQGDLPYEMWITPCSGPTQQQDNSQSIAPKVVKITPYRGAELCSPPLEQRSNALKLVKIRLVDHGHKSDKWFKIF